MSRLDTDEGLVLLGAEAGEAAPPEMAMTSEAGASRNPSSLLRLRHQLMVEELLQTHTDTQK